MSEALYLVKTVFFGMQRDCTYIFIRISCGETISNLSSAGKSVIIRLTVVSPFPSGGCGYVLRHNLKVSLRQVVMCSESTVFFARFQRVTGIMHLLCVIKAVVSSVGLGL